MGYQVRLDSRIKPNITRLIYMTEGMLLRKAMTGRDLEGFGVIIIDEAHERTIEVDLLMGYLKGLVKIRKDLKVIIMSATMNIKRFQRYFNCSNDAIIKIPGRTFSINYRFLQKPTNNYINTAIDIILAIHKINFENGHILVFLTGFSEIIECYKKLTDATRNNRIWEHNFGADNSYHQTILEHNNNQKHSKILKICKLYSGMTTDDEKQAFEAVDWTNIRKVIVSTNIAETSLTIKDVTFVIDCGFSKQKIYFPNKRIEALGIREISRASVKQRVGRAGRTRPGILYLYRNHFSVYLRCYIVFNISILFQCVSEIYYIMNIFLLNNIGTAFLLYTKQDYKNLDEESKPEIFRSSLINEMLTMLSLGIDNPLKFDYLDPPNIKTITDAFKILRDLKVVDMNNKLTNLGREVSELPVDPRMAIAILKSYDNNCVDEICTIAAMIEIQQKLYFRQKQGGNAESKRYIIKEFAHVSGDHLTLLNIFNAYTKNENRYDQEGFCRKYNINFKSMKQAMDIKTQLLRNLCNILNNRGNNDINSQISFGKNSKYNAEVIIKTLLEGYFMHCAVQGINSNYWIMDIITDEKNDQEYQFVKCTDKAKVHSSSIFKDKHLPDWIIYHDLCIEQQTNIKIITCIHPEWLLQVAKDYYNPIKLKDDNSQFSKILKNSWKNLNHKRSFI